LQEQDTPSAAEFGPKAGICEMNLCNFFGPKIQAHIKLWYYKKGHAKCSHLHKKLQKLNVGLVPKSCRYAVKGGLEDQDPKLKSGLGPNIMQIHCRPGCLEDYDPKSEISKIKFGSKIEAPTKLWKYQQIMLNAHF
jgi:hypothetical protein